MSDKDSDEPVRAAYKRDAERVLNDSRSLMGYTITVLIGEDRIVGGVRSYGRQAIRQWGAGHCDDCAAKIRALEEAVVTRAQSIDRAALIVHGTQPDALPPCPFCGETPTLDDEDFIEQRAFEHIIQWIALCPNAQCGAMIEGDSRADCLRKWIQRERKMPPREPDERMQRAGVEAMFDRDHSDGKLRDFMLTVRKGWRAMWDVSP